MVVHIELISARESFSGWKKAGDIKVQNIEYKDSTFDWLVLRTQCLFNIFVKYLSLMKTDVVDVHERQLVGFRAVSPWVLKLTSLFSTTSVVVSQFGLPTWNLDSDLHRALKKNKRKRHAGKTTHLWFRSTIRSSWTGMTEDYWRPTMKSSVWQDKKKCASKTWSAVKPARPRVWWVEYQSGEPNWPPHGVEGHVRRIGYSVWGQKIDEIYDDPANEQN